MAAKCGEIILPKSATKHRTIALVDINCSKFQQRRTEVELNLLKRSRWITLNDSDSISCVSITLKYC